MAKLLLIVALCLGCRGKEQRAEPMPVAGSAAPVVPAGDVIELKKPISRELGRGEVHRFRVELPAGQVALGVVEQDGVDLVVTVLGPAGAKVSTTDSPNGTKGPEPLAIEAKTAGWYVIELRPYEDPAAARTPSQGPARRYTARLDEIVSIATHEERQMSEKLESPRLLRLWKDLRGGRREALAEFWTEMAGKAPLVEPFSADPKDVLISFVFKATGAPYVGMFQGPGQRERPLRRLESTDVWYLTARMPKDARFMYSLIATTEPPAYRDDHRAPNNDTRYATKAMSDPLNPRVLGVSSVVELPDAPPQPWIVAKPGTPAGTVAQLTIESKHLGERRRIGVYTPPVFDPKREYPLVVVYDGESYGLDAPREIPLPTIADNLIAANKIPPIVIALVDTQGTRNRDLTGSKPFADFIALELVPQLRREFRATANPAKTIVAGLSYGGLCAVYTALQHSGVFGNALSQSGAFGFMPGETEIESTYATERGWLIREVVKTPAKPIRFWLEIGRFETNAPNDLLGANRRMRDVLEAKGYAVTYSEFNGNHEYLSWRGTIADGLMALLK